MLFVVYVCLNLMQYFSLFDFNSVKLYRVHGQLVGPPVDQKVMCLIPSQVKPNPINMVVIASFLVTQG